MVAAATVAAQAGSASRQGGTASVLLVVMLLLGLLFLAALAISLRRWRRARAEGTGREPDDGNDPWVEAGKRMQTPPRNEPPRPMPPGNPGQSGPHH
jgi:hypothetical protein